MQIGTRIAQKRKEQGMTQIELAEAMHVTRQTVSRWEGATVLPDVEKIAELAAILQVSCDYLLCGDASAPAATAAIEPAAPSPLLQRLVGQTVKLTFYDDEEDWELFNKPCEVIRFDGKWLKVRALDKKITIEKLVAIASILSVDIVSEQEDA